MSNSPNSSESIKSLERESAFLENPDQDDPSLIVPSENITKAQAIQNDDSTWSVIQYEEKNPNELHSTIINKDMTQRETLISNLGEVSISLDQELLNINAQINSKKSQIVSTIASAVSAGCSMIQYSFAFGFPLIPILAVDAADVNGTGVAIGAGLTVRQDTASIKIYPSLSNYATDNPLDPDSTQSLSSSNLGDGYLSFVGSNDGSILSSDYKEIDPSPLSPPPNQSTCISYYNTITSLANEINSLRSQRSSVNLSDLNVVKKERFNQQLQEWAIKSTDESLKQRQTGISTVITSIQSV